MKTLLPSWPWTLALVCAMPMGGAWGQSVPSPAHVQAAQEAGWDAVLFESAVGLADDLDRRGINLGL